MTPRDLALLTGATLEEEAWRDEALCTGVDPASFFSTETGARGTTPVWGAPRNPVEAAQALCGACPVAAACLEHALRTPETHGVWGGTTPAERESILLGLAG